MGSEDEWYIAHLFTRAQQLKSVLVSPFDSLLGSFVVTLDAKRLLPDVFGAIPVSEAMRKNAVVHRFLNVLDA